ncbi:kynurenine/alpha-aminoadipate aminotransferase, mitochondrial [Ostrinia nubilalis]|uniref:kynurenine/alpha-aminoadipate aminotransferase, mitochondrial n=1 Tax=Ostrinia nubilalis TaxID=29057 RepID=UPI003082657E
MLVTIKLNKFNSEVVKKILDLRPLYSVVKKNYSKKSDDLFKCYSDEPNVVSKYAPLTEGDYGRFISKRAGMREPALTRQMTSLAYKVGKQMISLAEGMPNEEVFPYTKLTMESRNGLSVMMEGKELSAALQYLPSQGHPALLNELRQFQEELHRPPPVARDVMVTNGGQHGIYQCVDMLVDPGDPVIVNEYAYTGIHVTLKPYHPEIVSIPEDVDGLIPETLESVLQDRLNRGLKMPKMLYVIPTGSNPSGTVIPEERRRRIYELACRFDFIIVEDDPYMFLNYSEGTTPSFLSMDTCGRVIRLDSLSKVVSAGLRAGWVTAPAPLLSRMELHMQGELLHSCTLSQAILLRLLSQREALASHLLSARTLYRTRRDALHEALQPTSELMEWALPRGGLFFWARVRGVEDVYKMVFDTAFNRGLMLVPGQAFAYDTSAPCQYIRLTFSKIRFEDMNTAASLLADIIRDEQARTLQKPQRFATER